MSASAHQEFRALCGGKAFCAAAPYSATWVAVEMGGTPLHEVCAVAALEPPRAQPWCLAPRLKKAPNLCRARHGPLPVRAPRARRLHPVPSLGLKLWPPTDG